MKKSVISLLSMLSLVLATATASAASRIEYILDVSGSMNALSGGEKRIDAAKKSLTAMVQGIPDGTIVALRLYSHRVPPADKAKSCQDTELVIPFGPINKPQFLSVVNAASPLGQTPIAYSLEQAANDFVLGADEAQTIILVSDGEESCGGDPVAVAKALIAKGFKLKINVIGFDVDANAKNQLAAIAGATGGQYFDAKDSASLTGTLQKLTQESLVIQKAGSSVYGEEIRGGDNYETSVPLPLGKLFRLNHHQKVNQYDYFVVDAKPGQKIVIALETGEKGVRINPDNTYEENLNPYAGISLQSPQKTQIAHQEIIGGKNDARQIVFPVPTDGAGKYYVLVGSSYDNQHKDHRFKVEISELFDAGSKQDAGDTRDTALVIQPGTHKGYVNPNDEVDTYRVQLPAGSVTIRARPVSEKVQMGLELFDAEGVRVGGENAPNAGAVAKMENLPLAKAGEYVLKVKGGYNPAETEYTLEIIPGGGAAPAADAGAPPAPAAPTTPTAPAAPSGGETVYNPLSKPVPMPRAGTGALTPDYQGIAQLWKQMDWKQKAKVVGFWTLLPAFFGWLVGWIWGYLKGRASGKRWAARQAAKQNTAPPAG
ncbi:MAG: VWA domain-containing protein [Deltaproteobacteria bacterium]|nr:VWA domain-containing protein [Deltaproteobacteria bacterium]